MNNQSVQNTRPLRPCSGNIQVTVHGYSILRLTRFCRPAYSVGQPRFRFVVALGRSVVCTMKYELSSLYTLKHSLKFKTIPELARKLNKQLLGRPITESHPRPNLREPFKLFHTFHMGHSPHPKLEATVRVPE